MVLPRLLGRTAYPTADCCCSLTRTSLCRRVNGGTDVRMLKAGVSGPVSLRADRCSSVRPGMPKKTRPKHRGPQGHAFNAPTPLPGPVSAHFPSRFRLVLSRAAPARCPRRFRPVLPPQNPRFRGRQSLCPRAIDRPAECSVQEPFWERPAGPKHTRAERRKARTTPLRPSRISTRS
jgi:hypothetical protein